MRKHNGMRPQDVPILLKIVALKDAHWQLQPLSNMLRISMSEISESLNRSRTAGLIDFKKKRPNKLALMEFLEHGLKYVFPQEPGPVTKGILTAHSHSFMKQFIKSDENYIWPSFEGKFMGQTIEPFYGRQVEAVKDDPDLYKLLALTDVLRVGRVREVEIAKEELRKIINESSRQHTED